MTRWARAGNVNKKKPHDASSWEELQQEIKQRGNQQQTQRQSAGRTNKRSLEKGHDIQHKKKKTIASDVEQGMRLKKVDDSIKTLGKKKKVKGGLEQWKMNEQKRVEKTRLGSDQLQDGHTQNDLEKQTHKHKQDTTAKDSTCWPTAGANSKLKGPSSQSLSSGKSLVDALLEMDGENSGKKRKGGIEEDSGLTGTPLGSHEFLDSLRKKEKRSEERRLKRQKKKMDSMVCFHCRQSGHGVADCPDILGDVEQGTGICFRCGSTEHDVSKCSAKVDKKLGEFPYAKCFICQQTGHLSRMCPDNPRGLYPEGGGCKECGSVEHRWWNCPIKKPVKGVNADLVTLTSGRKDHASADAEPAFLARPKVKVKKAGPKVVVF